MDGSILKITGSWFENFKAQYLKWLLGNWCLDLFFGLKTNYSTKMTFCFF